MAESVGCWTYISATLAENCRKSLSQKLNSSNVDVWALFLHIKEEIAVHIYSPRKSEKPDKPKERKKPKSSVNGERHWV
jgi:hypothetical protein